MKRDEIISKLSEFIINPVSVRVSIVDYSNNPLAPEKVAYKVTGKSFGESFRFMYYPNTIGFQGY